MHTCTLTYISRMTNIAQEGARWGALRPDELGIDTRRSQSDAMERQRIPPAKGAANGMILDEVICGRCHPEAITQAAEDKNAW